MLPTPDPHALHRQAGTRLAAASAALARGEAERGRRLRGEAEQLLAQCREAMAIPNIFRGTLADRSTPAIASRTSRKSEV